MLPGKALLEVLVALLFKLPITSPFTEISIQNADQGPGSFSRFAPLTLTSHAPASPRCLSLAFGANTRCSFFLGCPFPMTLRGPPIHSRISSPQMAPLQGEVPSPLYLKHAPPVILSPCILFFLFIALISICNFVYYLYCGSWFKVSIPSIHNRLNRF